MQALSEVKSSMTDEQRKTVLNGIAHEEDVSKLRALNSVLITARENDIIKRPATPSRAFRFPHIISSHAGSDTHHHVKFTHLHL